MGAEVIVSGTQPRLQQLERALDGADDAPDGAPGSVSDSAAAARATPAAGQHF